MVVKINNLVIEHCKIISSNQLYLYNFAQLNNTIKYIIVTLLGYYGTSFCAVQDLCNKVNVVSDWFYFHLLLFHKLFISELC